ncbi:tryptophan synthase subunit alpha [Granulosicoccaceae sp. 1_MG-2023]|nr:tryptophan synthase subunit alpha [Granulosicoccaceae sp. 1_MG-2023]
MSRIAACFTKAAAAKRTVLVPYLMGCDPDMELSLALMHALVEAGADMLELGMPFSDPMADGPVIQAASERVLAAGVRLPQIFELAAKFRETDQDTPLILMGYANPIEITGHEDFARQAQAAGVDGVITVDMPPEESVDLSASFEKHAIDPIFLLSPTTPDHRIEAVTQYGRGFIYYVSLKGVTGSSQLDTGDVAERVGHIKTLTDLPVGVGFGISDPASAASVATLADAVVVGSAIVKRIAACGTDRARLLEEVPAFVGSLRQAIDQA